MKGPREGRSYGRMIRSAYEYWFGQRFERERLRIRDVLVEVAQNYSGDLRDDVSTDLFPLVVVERRSWMLVLRIMPSFRGKDGFEAVVTIRSSRVDPKEYPFPILNCISINMLDRDMGAPWLDQVQSGVDTFDARFVSRVLPDGAGKGLLTPRVRNGLLGLYFNPQKMPNLWFECQSNFIRVKQAMEASEISPSLLRPLSRGALRVFLEIEAPAVAANRPLPGRVIGVFDEKALCRICGEVVLSRVVRCIACDTTHHQECFDYAETCAIYGCGGTRYRLVISR